MVVYEDKFTHIKSETLTAVRKCVRAGLWRLDEAEGFHLLRDLVNELSDIYGLPIPPVQRDGHSHYNWHIQRIYLDKPSLVSFLHEYRHHMQVERGVHDGSEHDARGWSLSVFKLALPRSFEHAKERGILKFVRRG